MQEFSVHQNETNKLRRCFGNCRIPLYRLHAGAGCNARQAEPLCGAGGREAQIFPRVTTSKAPVTTSVALVTTSVALVTTSKAPVCTLSVWNGFRFRIPEGSRRVRKVFGAMSVFGS